MDKELFELCKEVYKRTGWSGTVEYFESYPVLDEVVEKRSFSVIPDDLPDLITPLYTSDFLLERLPKHLERKDSQYGALRGTVDLTRLLDIDWEASYRFEDEMNPAEFKYASVSDTPLKALLKLTIALHEAGQLSQYKEGK